MQMTIRGHHLSITPAIENTIREKFAQMTKHLDQVNSVQVKLSKDHQLDKLSRKGSGNHIAEAIVRLPGVELFAQASADDMYSSITQLTEKLKRQYGLALKSFIDNDNDIILNTCKDNNKNKIILNFKFESIFIALTVIEIFR